MSPVDVAHDAAGRRPRFAQTMKKYVKVRAVASPAPSRTEYRFVAPLSVSGDKSYVAPT